MGATRTLQSNRNQLHSDKEEHKGWFAILLSQLLPLYAATCDLLMILSSDLWSPNIELLSVLLLTGPLKHNEIALFKGSCMCANVQLSVSLMCPTVAETTYFLHRRNEE